MAKSKQTRRSVSISGELYAELKAFCAKNELSHSGLIEELARRALDMPERDPEFVSTLSGILNVPLRSGSKGLEEVEDDKEEVPPREDEVSATPVLEPAPVSEPAPAPEFPKETESLQILPPAPPKPRRLREESPPDPFRPREHVRPKVDKPATPDAPDPATEDVLAAREAERVAAASREAIAAERRKKFDDWARQHATPADVVKPNGQRRGGNVLLF